MLELELLPSWYLPLITFVLGGIIGSFLNVVCYRFHTGRSLAGRSHCLSCGRQLRWFELVPMLSYLTLRGRCRTCGCRVPSRYAVVELATALLFLIAWQVSASWFEFSLLLLLGVVSVFVVVYDIYHFIIPNEVVLAFGLLAIVELARVWWGGAAISTLLLTVLAAGAASGFFWLLWYLSRGQWLGFGDVKLAFPLGLLVGSTGAFSLVVLSFWIGAAVSLLILSYERWGKRGQPTLQFGERPLTMKSAVPFAPFLIASFICVRFFSIDVLALLTY